METPPGRRSSRQTGRIPAVPVIGGGAVVLLLIAAVFLRGFERRVGDASLAGRYAVLPLLSSRTMDSLTLSWNGLSLQFSRASTPRLFGVDAADNTTDILLDGGSRIRLTPGRDTGGSLTLVPVSGGAAAAVVIPYSLAGVPTVAPAGAALAWRSAGRNFVLTLPAAGKVDADAETITLPLAGNDAVASLSTVGVTAVAAAPTRARPVVTVNQTGTVRLPDEKSLPTTEDLQAGLGAWMNAAWAGWSRTRFSADDALWRMSDGSLGFSEDLGTALLAESVARGTWQTFFSLWSDAQDRQQARGSGGPLAFVSSVYVGGTRDFARVNAARSSALLDQARGFLTSSDPSLLHIRGLLPLVEDHGDPALLTSILAYVTGRISPPLDLEESLGLGEDLVEAAERLGMDDATRKALQDAVGRRIIPSVQPTDAGLFLQSTPAVVDTGASLRAGALLLRAGTALADTRTAAIGRGMIVAALALADTTGTLPASLHVAGGKIASRSGSLVPEAVYGVLPTGRPVPRELSLSDALGPGVSIWTAARVITADRQGSTFRLVLGYPAGVPDYFVIQGIGAFSQVQVHAIPWHADPSFAKYPNGWFYDATARLFHAKLTGRTDQEEIDITF
jgi:hypothetical protein